MEDTELGQWMEEVSGPEWIWYVKYLSANDTYAKENVHQAGPYIGKELLGLVFPNLARRAQSETNPDTQIQTVVGSHDDFAATLRLVWYNSKRLGQRNGRDEARLTRWGHIDAPVVAPECTGSLTIFAYHRVAQEDADSLRVWVARNEPEHDRIVERIGPVEPGNGLAMSPTGVVISTQTRLVDGPCNLAEAEIPDAWKTIFPSGGEVVLAVVERLLATRSDPVDKRLLKRRACEYAMFLAVESYHVMPRLAQAFVSVDDFVEYANAVTNRRKSRSGRSLELQLLEIFREEGLQHAHGVYTEGRRKPDFIFPSDESYWDATWPDERLRMLGAKTTVKDRWRQILNEARRVETKHLLTLQEGVSVEQFREMQEEGIVLVVPQGLHRSYPEAVRPNLLTLERFIEETRAVCS